MIDQDFLLNNLIIKKEYTVNGKLSPVQSYFNTIKLNGFDIDIDSYKRNSFRLPDNKSEYFSCIVWGELERLEKINFQPANYIKKKWKYKGETFINYDDNHINKVQLRIYKTTNNLYYPKLSKEDLIILLNKINQ
jgi:hypothetical protein